MNTPLHTPLAAAIHRFDRIVSPRIADPAERRRHAALLAALVGAGLFAALWMPFAGFAVGGMRAPMLAAMCSGFCLLLAALLSVSGAFETVVGSAVAGATTFLAAAATVSGGVASPLLWLLPIAGAGGALAVKNRRGLACLAIASLGLAFVFGASANGWTSGAAAPRHWALVLVGCVALALALCARRLGFRSRALPDDAAEPAVPGRELVRFSPNGEILDVSDLASAWFGDRLAGERLPFALSVVHVADRVRFLSACGEVRSGRAVAVCRARLSVANGDGYADVELSFVPVLEGDSLTGIRLDVVDDGEAAPEPSDLEAALGEARAASLAKTQFLAMVSHELRTPLNAIIGFSDVLDRELFGSFPDPRQKEYVGLIRQSGEHLLSVVNGLLDVSKIEAGRYELVLEEFSIADVLESVAATVRAEAEAKGLRFALVSDCRTGRMTGDRRAVYQMLLNLAANAVKFTDAGSVEIAARDAEGFLRVTVTDTGIGIAPADIPRLGQPFVQASTGLSRRYPGTGLGLSLAKGFAELHRGSLSVSSELGRGTAVEVLLSLDCAGGSLHNDALQKVVTLKHARTQEAHSTHSEARRSA